MAKQFMLSSKHLAIDKANSSTILAVSLAVFIVVFSLVASKSLLNQRAYQAKVIGKKEVALRQLDDNVKEVDRLMIAYQEFAGDITNALGGNPTGNAERDGENPRIVLDALPSQYDFPAVATSMSKLVADNGFSLQAISGIDDEVNQAEKQSSENPEPVEMPFNVEATIAGTDGLRFMQLFERSIRPIQVQKLTLSGQGGQLKASVTAKTYFQPQKNLDIKSETVK